MSHKPTTEPEGGFCEFHEMVSEFPRATFVPAVGDETLIEAPDVWPPTYIVTVPTVFGIGIIAGHIAPGGHENDCW